MKNIFKLLVQERIKTIFKIIWEILLIIILLLVFNERELLTIQNLILIITWITLNLILGNYREDYRNLTPANLSVYYSSLAIFGTLLIFIVPNHFDIKFSFLLIGVLNFNRTLPTILKKWGANTYADQNALLLGIPGDNILNLIQNISGKNIVGIMSDIPSLKSKKLFGIPIYEITDSTLNKFHEKKIDSIYQVDKEIQTVKRNTYLKTKLIQKGFNLFEVDTTATLKGNINFNTIFSNYQELILGRNQIKVNIEKVKEYYLEKKILIFGGCGSIGSEIVEQIIILDSLKEITIVDNNEEKLFHSIEKYQKNTKVSHELIDIKNSSLVRDLLSRTRPDIVYNAAAYKHVPIVENNSFTGLQNNVLGCLNIIQSCIEFNASTHVLVSSDKAVNPTNIMGASKRICELLSSHYSNQSKHTKFIITRFGNVLGSSGSVIPIFLDQIRKSKPITITDFRMRRYFMSIPEASSLVIESSRIGNNNDLLIFDMHDQIKIIDLAKRLINICGEDSNTYPIIETGLRSGEKLYEEIFLENENQKRHKESNSIFIGEIEKVSSKQEKNIKSLLAILKNNELHSIKSFDLSTIVPTYKKNE